jgi:uncharacterized protein
MSSYSKYKNNYISYPFQIDKRGRTALVSKEEDYIHQLVEQVLFTSQGERVNRPTFGSNLNQLVFAPNSDDIVTATQLLVQAALQEWLTDFIQVEFVQVTSENSLMRISVQYRSKRTQQRQVVHFIRDLDRF